MLDRSLFENILGQVTSGAKDLNAKVDNRLGDNAGLAKGAALGGVAALLLGGKTKHILQAGGMAALGALAYKAMSNSGNNSTPAPAGAAPQASGGSVPQIPAGIEPADSTDEDRQTRLFLTAMIAAANADGHITAEEKARITGALDNMDVSTEERLFLLDEMMAPKSLREVASQVSTDVEGGEVYLVSSMVIDKDDDKGKSYLENLAMVLGLDAGTVTALEEAAAGQAV